MKLKILILWLFTSSLLFSYESIGKFNGGRAIVKEGSKWGIIDSSYNEYFFSNYVEFAGKKLRIKEIKDFYNINKSKYIKNTPIKDGFICKVILEETVLDGINKFLYFTINGENLKIRDFTTKEHLQSTVFLTNPESNRFANNWIFQISNPQKYRKGIFEFNTFYLDTDTNGIVCGYQIFSAGKFDYIGSSQKEETNFKDIRIPVAKNNKWGYVDGEGNQKVDLKFKFAFSFHNNIGVVIKENGYYSFIDLEGNLNDNEFELLGSFNSNGEAVFLTKIYNNPELYKKNPRAPNEFHYKMGLIDNKGKIIKEVNDCQPLLDLAWDISFDANLFIKHYEKKNSRAEIKAYWDKQQIYKTFETIKTEDEKTKKDINVGGLIAGIFGPSTEEYIKQYTILTNYKNPYYLYPRNMTS
ncbi:MAG: WG repeat-containing protein, partial [Romboutsia sp.]|nr:WG repeat-containing protein [Romboutsia sp.]